MENKIDARDVMRQYGMDSSVVVLPEEDAAAFHRMRDSLFERFQPVRMTEIQWVETIAVTRWKLARYRNWLAVCEAKAQGIERPGVAGPKATDAEVKRWARGAKNWAGMVARLENTLRVTEKSLVRMQTQRRKDEARGVFAPTPHLERAVAPADAEWSTSHAAISENGKIADRQQALEQLNKLREELRPVVGHG